MATAGDSGPYWRGEPPPPAAYPDATGEAADRAEPSRRRAQPARSAVVVGAGIAGLAAAGAIARCGWQVTLLERGDRLRGTGGAVLLWPNGLAALTSLGLSFGDAAFPQLAAGLRRPDGRWLVPPEPASGVRPMVVHADDLHDALMTGLDGSIEIRTGTEVTTVRAGVPDRPAVGTGRRVFEADLVVAADGANSLVRRRLQPRSAVVSAGYTAWRAVIPWFRAPVLPDGLAASGELLGAGQRFLYATLGERSAPGTSARGGIYWTATAPGAERPESAPTQLGLLRRWFAGWPAPVGDLLAATEPDDMVQQPGLALRPLPRTFGVPAGSGGFVLLGDAAHGASPSLRIGACLALEDAATLRALLRASAGPLPAVLAEFTAARRPRVGRVARVSRWLGEVLQARGRWSGPARDALLRRMPQLLERATCAATAWSPPLG